MSDLGFTYGGLNDVLDSNADILAHEVVDGSALREGVAELDERVEPREEGVLGGSGVVLGLLGTERGLAATAGGVADHND